MSRYSTLAALAAVLLAAQPCLAEPVTITGGSAGLFSDGQLTSFSFVCPRTSIVQDSRNPWGPSGFTAGTAVQFSGSLNPESTHGFQMIVNGTTYDDVVLTGMASFVTDTYTAIPGDPSAGQVELALFLTGHFDAFVFGHAAGTPLFSFDVNLPGVFRANFDNVTDDIFLNRSFAASAQFGAPASPSATPEPSSLLLLGTPLGAMLLRRVRSRTALSGSTRAHAAASSLMQ